MKKAEKIFESYNDVIRKSYDEVFEKAKNPKEVENKIEPVLKRNMNKWEMIPVKEVDKQTPQEFFNEIKDLNKLIDVFKKGAQICDMDLPSSLKQRLKDFKEESINEFKKISADKKLIRDDEKFLIPLAAIRILGEWKVDNAVDHLINILFKSDRSNELLMETVQKALIDIGQAAAEPVLNRLEGTKDIDYTHKYLILVITEVGREKPSDRIYQCIQDTFSKMDDKVLGALCLGDYGDERAVPSLRKFLKLNTKDLDKATYYEIKRTIIRLGGDAEDL